MLYSRFRHKITAMAAGSAARRNRKRGFPILIIVILFLIVIIAVISAKIQPVVSQLAEAAATDIITLTVNDAVSERMADGSLDYDQLIDLEKDENGNISALTTNMSKVNTMQAEIANAIISKLAEKEITNIRVPLGNVIGGTLFSGRGPYIPVKIVSLNNVDTRFTNEFTSAGINQTQHQILLHVDVSLDLLLPSGTESTSVSIALNVAETIIVGIVPETYSNFDISQSGQE